MTPTPIDHNSLTYRAALALRFLDTPLLIHPRRLDVIRRAIEAAAGVAPDALPAAGPSGDSAAGVCVIPIFGVLVKRSQGLAAVLGMTTYLRLRSAIWAALEDPSCRAIVLDVDSPGGESGGMFELADFIASARGVKPIIALANDAAYSAAYGIASAADRVLVTDVGGTGSIGCYMLHCDMSRADRDQGVKYTYISSGEHKVEGNPHEPLAPEVMATLQAKVDRVREMFVDMVARNRDVSPKTIFDTQAACFMGAGSCPLLADGVGTLSDAISLAAELASAYRSSSALQRASESFHSFRATAMAEARLKRVAMLN